MKRIILLAAVLLVAATTTRAQEFVRSNEGFYYGITAGINVANMAKDEGGEALVRTNAGVFGGYRVGRFFAAQAELVYSGSGTSKYLTELDNTPINDIVHLNLNYINIPVTAKLYLYRGLNIHAGAQVGFLVRKRFNYRGDKYDLNGLMECNSVDFCVPVGIGYDFGHLTFDARYQQGTVDVIKDDGKTTYNTLLCFNLGYKF